jgi:hypothetical protein
MRRVVARFNFLCNPKGNRPQSLTGHIVKRWGAFELTLKQTFANSGRNDYLWR